MQLPYCFLFYLFITIQPVFAQNSIEITDAWISEAPPTVKILAGYFTIVNLSDDPVDLTGAQSPVFERVEFHLTKIRDGVAHMQKEEIITIPAQTEFSFSPGEYHLMLFNPTNTPKSGDLIPLQLTFSNGIRIDVDVEVKRGNQTGHHHH
jgi:periplasmic copper chaperone A